MNRNHRDAGLYQLGPSGGIKPIGDQRLAIKSKGERKPKSISSRVNSSSSHRAPVKITLPKVSIQDENI